MKRATIRECPSCQGALQVRELYCPSCRLRIQGDFQPAHTRLSYLNARELEFVELFVRLRGNIKEVEKALGVSYPTVRGMLDSVIRSLGYPPRGGLGAPRRREILEMLERGQIGADRAAALLRGEGAEEPETGEE